MATDCKVLTIKFKRGDDFKLDFTIQDTNNTTAIANAAILANAQQILADLEAAVPQDPVAIAAAQTTVSTAQTAYDNSIIVDITGWTMSAQVRRAGKLIATLTITILDTANGIFSITETAANTASWPTNELECDIEFTRPTGKVSSETFIIDVQRDITQ